MKSLLAFGFFSFNFVDFRIMIKGNMINVKYQIEYIIFSKLEIDMYLNEAFES